MSLLVNMLILFLII